MINFNLKKIKAIAFDVDGVLSAETITLHPDGEPQRTVNIKDGYAIQLAIKLGIKIAIITGGNTQSVRKRYEGLGITDIFMGSAVKIKIFDQWLKQHQLKAEEVIFMGDDIPDYEVLKACGCPCCPNDAVPEVRAISTYISPIKGGYGCARDIIEQVLRAQGKWMADEKAFGW